jgi:hypothetical protein
MLATLDCTGQGSKLIQGMAIMGFLWSTLKPDVWHQIIPLPLSEELCDVPKRFIVSKFDFKPG